MRFEHFALNVPDARAAGEWYVANLGFTLGRHRDDAPYTRFLADDSGRTILEIFTNPSATIPDYAHQHWLVFHWALVSRNLEADIARLERAGATVAIVEDIPDGSRVVMMRDPWGVPFQLCRRVTPMP